MQNNQTSNAIQTVFALTTFDNPFNPFEDFTSWFLYDVEKGYNTCGCLARIAKFQSHFTEKEKKNEIERAIDVIIENDFLNIYKKVSSQEQMY